MATRGLTSAMGSTYGLQHDGLVKCSQMALRDSGAAATKAGNSPMNVLFQASRSKRLQYTAAAGGLSVSRMS